MKPAQPNQSLIDGLACLQALAAHGGPIGSRQLGRMLGLEPTRVNRLLKTLAHLGLAQQDEKRKYAPGPAIHVLAAQSLRASGLLTNALGPLEGLLEFGYQVAMGVLWRDQVVYLYFVSPGADPRQGIAQEPLFPAHHSGLGQALLAMHTDDEVRELYAGTPHAGEVVLDGANGLLADLARTREQGYALTRVGETGAVGWRTLALVLDGQAGTAIGLAGDFTDRSVPRLVRALRSAAATIAEASDRRPRSRTT
ncbi:IclR family transcriptional regulator [Micromonospora sp. SL1-18]|uniref:IclR family transcriptional regulator n=1 Tax=Micromonospora sp. SL1-18 TaxID=3399128 RepID=UPI003A4E2112